MRESCRRPPRLGTPRPTSRRSRSTSGTEQRAPWTGRRRRPEGGAMEKRSISTTPEDPTVKGRPGWEGLHVWWLVNRAQTGSTGIVFNVTQFPPGKVHQLHRHPNCEEALYLLKGAGLHLSEDGETRQNEGDVVFIERG